MTPDTVIQALNEIGRIENSGLVMTRPTLLRYETKDLIPKPQRGGRGRGAGRWTEYPAGTVELAYAAWCLIHGKNGGTLPQKIFGGKPPCLGPEIVAQVKRIAVVSYNRLNKGTTDQSLLSIPPYNEIEVTQIDGEGLMAKARQLLNGASDNYNQRWGIGIGNEIVTVQSINEAVAWYSIIASYALLHLVLCVQAAKTMNLNQTK